MKPSDENIVTFMIVVLIIAFVFILARVRL